MKNRRSASFVWVSHLGPCMTTYVGNDLDGTARALVFHETILDWDVGV